jgi:hypothetical protein
VTDLDGLAERARELIDATTGNAAQGFTDETRAAVYDLTNAVADVVGEETAAHWVVTRWLITRRPIRECVEAERSS